MSRSLFALLVLACPVLLATQDAAVRVVVLNHVKVLDLTGGPAREDMAVVIRGSRIAAVTPANTVAVPSGAEVLDLSGKVALPGLADMHHHLGTGASMPGPPGPGQEVTREEPRNLAQMLAWGFTTIFSTSHPNPDIEEFISLRRQANEDAAPMPRFFGVGRAISVAGGHASQPRFASFLPTSADEARANVRALHAAGVDGIKLIYADQAHTGRPPVAAMPIAIMSAIIEEAHAVGLRAYVHAPQLRFAKEALRAGADGLVHSIADAPVDDEFIDLMKKNRASYTTTLASYHAFADVAAWMRQLRALDARGAVPENVTARFQDPNGAKAYHAFFGTFPPDNLAYARANVRRVFDAGIPVLAGTDSGVTGVLLGVSSQMELVLLVEAGLTPAAALRSATLTPAKVLGRDKDLGSVEPNKLADILLLDADPTIDIRNIAKVHRVVKGGVVYDPARLLGISR